MKSKNKRGHLGGILENRLFRLLVLVAVFTGISSCEDSLQEEAPSEFDSSDFYKDAATAEMGVMGIYNAISHEDFYGRWMSYELQGPTDISRFNRSNRDRNAAHGQVNDHIFTEDNQAISQAWAKGYEAIYAANLAIDGIRPLYETTSDEDIKFAYAEAHFLRGVVYFEMVKKWGDIPLKTTTIETVSEAKVVARTPQVEIYEQIEKDLKFAAENLPWASSGKLGRASKGAALGMLTRAYLAWAGKPIEDATKYEDARLAAKEIIESGEHQLLTDFEFIEPTADGFRGDRAEMFDNYPELWWNIALGVTDDTEIMWAIQYLYTANQDDSGWIGAWHGVGTADKSAGGPGRGDNRMPLTWSFYDSFEASDSIRRDYSCFLFRSRGSGGVNAWYDLPTNSSEGTPYYWGIGNGKFRRYLMPEVSENNNKESMDWPVIRYADVLLMYAEAALMTGTDVADGLEKLNMVRRRAHNLPVNTASAIDKGSLTLDVVIDERAWELCSEGLRKHDLIRWGILKERIMAAGAAFETRWSAMAPADNGFYVGHLNFKDHHVLWPIPNSEFVPNPFILSTDPTNNGYR
ncbi:RagB/SusD family nutrient uptake outer membrane protein [Marinoscillum sp. MHG1-6]|uniref:RagB/SusD family nutrient uptake outer membrane protein n=1 Tax=Marinoscillum sp. MHG1-6 TaxID=2959627 RepID=UPI0021578D3F|nr:RagB/SusD family nutrient uptake outer membrane protein [Marinoscillum sp. MHG1-6]